MPPLLHFADNRTRCVIRSFPRRDTRGPRRHSVRVQPNTVVHAATIDLDRAPVPAEQSLDGAPTTAAQPVTELAGHEIGVWEMTPGQMSDVEAEEVFVVLAGSATVAFADDSPTLHLQAGDVVRLAAGAETVWTVTETLRKVYLTGV